MLMIVGFICLFSTMQPCSCPSSYYPGRKSCAASAIAARKIINGLFFPGQLTRVEQLLDRARQSSAHLCFEVVPGLNRQTVGVKGGKFWYGRRTVRGWLTSTFLGSITVADMKNRCSILDVFSRLLCWCKSEFIIVFWFQTAKKIRRVLYIEQSVFCLLQIY